MPRYGFQEENANPSLASRFRQRANELHASPYVPFGAGARQKAQELLARSRRGQRVPGQNWDLRQFSDDELRLARRDPNFARELLRNYDPTFKNRTPTQQDISDFGRNIDLSAGARLWPNLQQGQDVPPVDPQVAARVREGFTARLAENRDLARQAETVRGRADRIAPLNPLHTTAKELIQGNNPRESLQVGQQEINAARRINIPQAIAPYLERASQTPDAYMAQYTQRYQPLIQNFREEARRNFLEHDMPSINNQFASRGAFYSGAREAALRKAMADKDARIMREIRNLTVHAQEQAMKDFNAERGHHLRQAEVAGHAHGAQRDANIRAAEALRVNALSQQDAVRQQAASLSNLGNIEQRQKQHEIDVAMQEHEREQERPWEQALREATLLGHIPPGSFQNQFSPQVSNPPPPNPLSAMGGILSQAAGLAAQPQQNYATGGHVRRGYAAGDSVKRAAEQLAQMKSYNQDSPEISEMRQNAQHFKNHQNNPMADYLFALGSHQLANLQEDPMKTYGEGSMMGMQAYKNAQNANMTTQEKYHNLIDKINQTKMYQQDFLAKHHGAMLQHEEMMRHHQAQEGESRRAHDLANEHFKATMEEKKNKLNLMRELAMEKNNKPAKKTSTQEKLEDKALEIIIENQEMRNDLGLMEDSLKQSLLGTGPNIGRIKSIFGIDNEIDALGNHIVTKANKLYGRGAGSNAQLRTIQGGKPGQTLSKKANEMVIKKYGEEAERKINKNLSYLLKAGWSPKDIETATGVKPPKKILDSLGISEEPEEVAEETPNNASHVISMIAPDGRNLRVPADKVEELSALGATYAK